MQIPVHISCKETKSCLIFVLSYTFAVCSDRMQKWIFETEQLHTKPIERHKWPQSNSNWCGDVHTGSKFFHSFLGFVKPPRVSGEYWGSVRGQAVTQKYTHTLPYIQLVCLLLGSLTLQLIIIIIHIQHTELEDNQQYPCRVQWTPQVQVFCMHSCYKKGNFCCCDIVI